MSGGVGSSAAMVSVMAHGGATPRLLPFPSQQLPMGLLTSCNSNQSYFSPKISHLSMQSSTRCSPTLKKALAATDSNQLSYADAIDEQQAKKYYFVVANAKFMLDEEEHFKELMYERLRLYGERNMEQDFWLVIEPKFLDKFPNITKRLKRPAVALVSTNGPWITFMKLRLDRVLAENFEAESQEEALASNPTPVEFEKPENWTAPYAKYEYGWWEAFLPAGSKEAKV